MDESINVMNDLDLFMEVNTVENVAKELEDRRLASDEIWKTLR